MSAYRVSDTTLADIAAALRKREGGASVGRDMLVCEALAIVEENQERRANDLTPDEIQQLGILRRYIRRNHPRWVDDIAILDKILAAHGIKPGGAMSQRDPVVVKAMPGFAERLCRCNMDCPLGRIGAQPRCTERELRAAGVEVAIVDDVDTSASAIRRDVELKCSGCERETLATDGCWAPSCWRCGGQVEITKAHDHVLTHAEAAALGYGIMPVGKPKGTP